MPTYDYECPEGHRFESFRAIRDRKEPIACPDCGEEGEIVLVAPTLWTVSRANPDVVYDFPANLDMEKVQKQAEKELAAMDRRGVNARRALTRDD